MATVLKNMECPALIINSADDQVNPPELGIAESLAAKIRGAKFIMLPITPDTRGHGTHSAPKVWGGYLSQFLASLPQR